MADDELTPEQIQLLSESIPLSVWTSIALAQLGLKPAQIGNFKKKHNRDMEAVSRDLTTRWKNKPSNKENQAKVRVAEPVAA